MKILHLSTYFAPIGGTETYLINLLHRLEEKNIDNVLIHRRAHPSTVHSNNSQIFFVPTNNREEESRKKIEQIISDECPNIIYLHDISDPYLIKIVSEMCPTIGYVHIFYPVCPGLGKLFRKDDEVCRRPFGLGCVPMIYIKRCSSARHPSSVYRIMNNVKHYLNAYQVMERIIVASQYMKELMIQNSIPEDRIEVLPPISTLPQIPNDCRNQVKSNSSKILFVGRLEYEKGLPYLLKAMAGVEFNYELIIAGDGSLKQEYLNLAQELGLTDNVKFVNWLSASALDELYSECNVTVMPSIMPEPFGIVGIEAMANGIPVIAFDVGGISDWLIDGYNGFLVPAKDISTLSQKIDLLLSDNELTIQFGENGRKFVNNHFSPDVLTTRLIEIFSAVIDG
jgi:glycosyltransferase involved in cell wall biosynthesis